MTNNKKQPERRLLNRVDVLLLFGVVVLVIVLIVALNALHPLASSNSTPQPNLTPTATDSTPGDGDY